jgi:hypothetical protein
VKSLYTLLNFILNNIFLFYNWRDSVRNRNSHYHSCMFCNCQTVLLGNCCNTSRGISNVVTLWRSAQCFALISECIIEINTKECDGVKTKLSSGAHPASCPMDIGDPFPGGKARPGVTLATHPNLVPRSRMSWCYKSSPLVACMAVEGQLYCLILLMFQFLAVIRIVCLLSSTLIQLVVDLRPTSVLTDRS